MKRLVLTEKEAQTPGFRMELDPGVFLSEFRVLSAAETLSFDNPKNLINSE